MRTPAKIYPVVIPAFGMVELAVVGDFFKVLSNTGTFTVNGDTFGNVGALLAGQGMRDAGFTRLQFTDTSGAQNALRVLVAGQDFIDDRITGEVSVIDGGKARTLSGSAFVGVVTNPSVAAQFSHVQLWNPAASGKNLVLSQFQLSSSSAQGVSARAHTAALANLFATNNPQSKELGGTVSAAQLRYESAVGFIPATGDLLAFSIAANTTFPFKLTEPIVIPPGVGLVLFSNSLAVPLTGGFEFYEEAI